MRNDAWLEVLQRSEFRRPGCDVAYWLPYLTADEAGVAEKLMVDQKTGEIMVSRIGETVTGDVVMECAS